jgi:hypothetical protein
MPSRWPLHLYLARGYLSSIKLIESSEECFTEILLITLCEFAAKGGRYGHGIFSFVINLGPCNSSSPLSPASNIMVIDYDPF